MSGGDAETPSSDGGTANLATVGNRGAARYSIPIVVPPGTNGVQPNLAFTHNSQSQANEILGIHWQLTGLPKVEHSAPFLRCPSNRD